MDLARERRTDEQQRKARRERFHREAAERKMMEMVEENLALRRRLDEWSAR